MLPNTLLLLCTFAFTGLLASKAPQPGRAGDQQLSREQLQALISAPPPLRGFQKKKGMVNPVEWLPGVGNARRANFRNWCEKFTNGTLNPLDQVPKETSGCHVLVNHDYRFFWIKSRKAAGTTLKAALGYECASPWRNPEGADMTYCSDMPWNAPVPEEGDPETWWKEYFVFTNVRNPYSRFASAYAFTKGWNCLNQSFGENCRNPFLMGEDCSTGECCLPSVAYLRHVREHTSCMFTKDGELAVDFVLSVEHLAEDFPVLVREINKRRRPGVPALSEDLLELNTNDEVGNGYVDAFEQNPECIGLLDGILENEFKDLKYIENGPAQ